MTKKTKNLLRAISIILVLFVILMDINVMDDIIKATYHIWVMVIAYGMLLATLR